MAERDSRFAFFSTSRTGPIDSGRLARGQHDFRLRVISPGGRVDMSLVLSAPQYSDGSSC